jgi:hypothetical protein
MLSPSPGTATPGRLETTSIPGVSIVLSHRFSHLWENMRFLYDTFVNAASSVSAAARCISGVTCE